MSNPQIVSNILLTMFSWGVRCDSRAELEDMLPALRVLHPHGPTGDICEARIEIGSSNWLGASQVLRQIDERDRLHVWEKYVKTELPNAQR